MKAHILVVEDDLKARTKLAYRLEFEGYRVTQSPDGESAVELMHNDTFDVILTDIVMGHVNGIDVLQVARQMTYRPAVILLTGHGSLETCIDALRTGAYDYLLKPCSPEKLLTCVEGAVQRHTAEHHLQKAAMILSGPSQSEGILQTELYASTSRLDLATTLAAPPHPMRIGKLTIGNTRHEVWLDGKSVRLTPIEYAMLHYLAQRNGQVCRYSDIVRYTHGMETNDADAQTLLRTHLRNLRKKLLPSYFVNDRGRGYMLVDPEL